jgi:hypothetical protein
MMLDYQQRMLEFKRNENREHHSKQALENLSIGRVDQVARGKFEGMQKQLPSRDSDDDRNHERENRNDRLLESFCIARAFAIWNATLSTQIQV